MLAKSHIWRSAYDELHLVDSRWTRILAKSTMQEVGPPHVQANLATPCVTFIPTLHVASIKYYDRVLEYMQQAVRRNPATVILLEGICDSKEAQQQQLAEYLQIAQNEELKETMIDKANSNNLYSPEVMHEICAELALDYDTLRRHEDTMRLQECYLKPKMAALCGANLRNDADLDMREVQLLLEEEAARLAGLGQSLPASVSVSDIGKFPAVRRSRELKVAAIARAQCEAWAEGEIEGEVILPWGFYHSSAIIHSILSANHHGGAEHDEAAAAAGKPRRPPLLFVEADELIAKVPFGVPKDLLEPASASPAPADTAAVAAAAGKDAASGAGKDRE